MEVKDRCTSFYGEQGVDDYSKYPNWHEVRDRHNAGFKPVQRPLSFNPTLLARLFEAVPAVQR